MQKAQVDRALRIGRQDKLACVAALRNMVHHINCYYAS